MEENSCKSNGNDLSISANWNESQFNGSQDQERDAISIRAVIPKGLEI